MNRLQQNRVKTEREMKEKAIRSALFSLDYYLMGLFMARESGDTKELEDANRMIEQLRSDLVRWGHYS